MSAGLARGSGIGAELCLDAEEACVEGWGQSSPGQPKPCALRRLLCEAR